MNLESLFGKIMAHTLMSVWKVIPFTSYRLFCVNCFLLPKPRRASQTARQTSSIGIVMVILQWVCNFAIKASFTISLSIFFRVQNRVVSQVLRTQLVWLYLPNFSQHHVSFLTEAPFST